MAQQEFKYTTSPCKNCDKSGCGSYHDKCEASQDFLQYNRAIQKQRIKDNMNFDDIRSSMRRMKKGRENDLKIFKSPKK